MAPHTVSAQRATRGCDADLGARVAGQDRARGTGLDMLEHDVGHVSDILSPILIPRVHGRPPRFQAGRLGGTKISLLLDASSTFRPGFFGMSSARVVRTV